MNWLFDLLRRLWPWGRRVKPVHPAPLDMTGPETRAPDADHAASDGRPASPAGDEIAPAPPPPPLEPPEETLPADPEAAPAEPTEIEPFPPSEADADAEPAAVEFAGETDGELADEVEDGLDEDAHDPDEEVFLEDDGDLEESVPAETLENERRAAEALERRRVESRTMALAGEHRIFLTEVAGPGSLAEALNRLVQEGLVTAEFQDDGEASYLLYRPLGMSAASVDPAESEIDPPL
jgi:hypothetical protein